MRSWPAVEKRACRTRCSEADLPAGVCCCWTQPCRRASQSLWTVRLARGHRESQRAGHVNGRSSGRAGDHATAAAAVWVFAGGSTTETPSSGLPSSRLQHRQAPAGRPASDLQSVERGRFGSGDPNVVVLARGTPLLVAEVGFVDRRDDCPVTANWTTLNSPPAEPKRLHRSTGDPNRREQVAVTATNHDVAAEPAASRP